ncbi:ABC transporter substrate-binding protein [Candidatus Halobeggiatoa sp. HSG11]|nr:ABC transporter substrate-binding protein [Candidatus Halobeggiatoa sp. HSG11]
MKFFSVMLLSVLVLPMNNVLAGGNVADAEALIKKSTVEVLDALQADSSQIQSLVKKLVKPNFSFRKMSSLVLGKHWKKASSDQKKKFSAQFRDLLVGTYSAALVEVAQKVNKNDIKYSSKATKKNRCKVSSKIKNGSTSVKVDYAMSYKKGKWKIYNVIVGGVSLVTTYRDEFGKTIKAKGIDGLIGDIAKKNKKG